MSNWQQVSPVLLAYEGGHLHYCEPCGMLHPVPNGWQWDGNEAAPTYSPSVRQHMGHKGICHYFIKAGHIEYCSDSHHALAGHTVPMPPIPEWAI